MKRDKFVNDTSRRYDYIGPELTMEDSIEGYGKIGAGPVSDFMNFGAFHNGRYDLGPTFDYNVVRAFFDGTVQTEQSNDLWEYLGDKSEKNSVEDDYNLTEKINAWYGMGSVDLSPKLKVIGGVRVEWTDSEISANVIAEDKGADTTEILPISGGTSFNTVLPNVQFRYEVNEDVLLRGAAVWSLGRPDYIDMAPIAGLEFEDDDGDGEYEGGVEIGNPDLRPYDAFNIEVSLSYYLPNSGVISVGYFYKDIDDPIYVFKEDFEDFEFEGLFFEEFERSMTLNAEPGEVSGLEINYQQNLTFLPDPFDGLGIAANYTFVDSSVSTFDRSDEVSFFLQPDYVGNIQVYFQKWNFEARLGYHWQGEALTEIGGNPDEDVYEEKRETMDFKASYQVNDKWRIYVEIQNLTDEPARSYTGVPGRIGKSNGNEIFGTTYIFGLGWNY